MTLRTRTGTLLLVSSAICLVVSAVSLRGSFQLMDSERWVQHTHEVLAELNGAMLSLRAAESSNQDFILTRDPAERAAAGQAEASLQVHLAAIARLTADNPVQQQRVRVLEQRARERLALLRRASEAAEQGVAAALPELRQGSALTARISELVQGMVDEESRLLAERSARSTRSGRFTVVTLTLGVCATLLLLVLGGALLLRSINRPIRRLMEGAQRFGAGALDHRVEVASRDEFGELAAALNAMADNRRRAEEVLRATSTVLESVIQATPVALVGLDTQCLVTTWNPAAVRLFGWTREEVLGRPPPVRREDGQPLLECVSGASAPKPEELSCRTRAGDIVEVCLTYAVMMLGEKRIGTMALVEELTERRRLEREREALLASSRRLARRFESIVYAAVGIADSTMAEPGELNGVLQGIVDQAREVVQADYAALGIGAGTSEPFEPWLFSGMPRQMEERLKHPRPVGTLGWVARRGQSLRVNDLHDNALFRGLPEGHPDMGPFLGVPIRYEGKSVGNLYLARAPGREPFSEEDQRSLELLSAYAGVVVENSRLYHGLVTERSRVELVASAGEALAKSLDYEKTLQTVAGLGVPGLAELAVLELVEGRGERWALRRVGMRAGSSAAQAILRRWDAPELARVEEGPYATVLRTGRPLLLREVPAAPEAGRQAEWSPRWAELELRSVMLLPLFSGEEVVGVLTLGSRRAKRFDADALSLARELAVRASLSMNNARLYRDARAAIRAREDMLAIVSHDLRNPLNSIRLTSQLIPRIKDNNEALERHLDTVRSSVDQMARLLGDLLNAAAIEAGRLSLSRSVQALPEYLAAALDSLRPAAEERHQRLELTLEPDLSELVFDGQRIRQVLGNLVGNAIKFTPEEGSIRVSVWQVDGEVRFAVRDSGPGIDAEELPFLFERYRRGKGAQESGTGLGLYIAKGIVEAHGGRVWVESQLGRGTTFFFSLPLIPAHPEAFASAGAAPLVS